MLTIRLTRQTKEAIEAAATADGRAVAFMAEQWLTTAAQGRADLDGLLGGLHVRPALEEMARVARLIEEALGDPGRDPMAREAVIEAWRVISERAFPYVSLTEWERESMVLREDARTAMRAALEVVKDDPAAQPADPLATPLAPLPAGLFGGRRPMQFMWGKQGGLVALLERYVFHDGLGSPDHTHELEELDAWIAERPNATEVQQARDALDRYAKSLKEAVGKQAVALRIGRDLAAGAAMRDTLRFAAALKADHVEPMPEEA